MRLRDYPRYQKLLRAAESWASHELWSFMMIIHPKQDIEPIAGVCRYLCPGCNLWSGYI